MATVGSAIATLQQAPIATSAQQVTNPVFQANASVAQAAVQQGDTVTLTAQAGQSQQTGTDNGNAQFGQAAAFFFAESQTFRAGNGSGGNQTNQTASVPQLPVKVTPAGSTTPNEPQANTNENAAAQVAANAAPSPSPDTPSAELAQLDDTLQEIGINPESISLFNRMAMLLYANDPAALRVLVQTLQSGAQQLNGGANNSSGDAGGSGVQSANALQALPPTQAQPAAQTNQAAPTNQQSVAAVEADPDPANAVDDSNQSASTPPIPTQSEANSARTSAINQPQTAAQGRNAPLSNQLEELNFTFAAVGAYPRSASNQQPGQLLNVTA
jgi:hypothetical protein